MDCSSRRNAFPWPILNAWACLGWHPVRHQGTRINSGCHYLTRRFGPCGSEAQSKSPSGECDRYGSPCDVGGFRAASFTGSILKLSTQASALPERGFGGWVNNRLDNRFPTSVTNAEGHTTLYGYDLRHGKPNEITDPNNQVTTITYDPLGRVTQVDYPDDAHFYDYAYDKKNRLQQLEASGGVVHIYAYVIESGKLQHQHLLTTSLPVEFLYTTRDYDARGWLVAVIDSMTKSSPTGAATTTKQARTAYSYWPDGWLKTVEVSEISTSMTTRGIGYRR
jgi:YD repeat-containing protein